MSHKDVTSSFLFYPQHVAAAGWIFNFFVSAVRWREDICVWRWFSVIHHVCSCTWSFFSCGSKSHYNVWLKIYGRRPPDRSVMKQTYKDLWWCCMYCKYTCVCVLLESWLMWFWDWLCFSILHESTHRSLWSSIMMSENRLRRGDKGSGGRRTGIHICFIRAFILSEIYSEMAVWWPLFPWQLYQNNLCPQHF